MNLAVYGVPECVSKHSTSKNDIKLGLEVMPIEIYRLRSEDIYK
jgi:hypothetical protein